MFLVTAQCQRALLTVYASAFTHLLFTLCGSPSAPFFKSFFFFLIYLAVPGLSFGTKNLQLPHANS